MGMAVASRCVGSLLAAVIGAMMFAPAAPAEPVDTGESAQSVIDNLKAEGYNVVINWLTATTPSRWRCARWRASTTPTIQTRNRVRSRPSMSTCRARTIPTNKAHVSKPIRSLFTNCRFRRRRTGIRLFETQEVWRCPLGAGSS